MDDVVMPFETEKNVMITIWPLLEARREAGSPLPPAGLARTLVGRAAAIPPRAPPEFCPHLVAAGFCLPQENT